VNISGATLYCTNSPCIICSKMLINAGVRRVVYLEGYPDDLSIDMLHEAGIEVCDFSRLPVSCSGGEP
jgi:dCMP deaminase